MRSYPVILIMSLSCLSVIILSFIARFVSSISNVFHPKTEAGVLPMLETGLPVLMTPSPYLASGRTESCSHLLFVCNLSVSYVYSFVSSCLPPLVRPSIRPFPFPFWTVRARTRARVNRARTRAKCYKCICIHLCMCSRQSFVNRVYSVYTLEVIISSFSS